MKNFAFTLAEILITLGIIAVVAALTIPSMITNIKNQGFAEKFKKTYSALQQAKMSIESETGFSFKDYQHCGNGSIENCVYLGKLFAQHLNTIDDYFAPDKPYKYYSSVYESYKPYKMLNGNSNNYWYYFNVMNCYILHLNDGTIIYFRVRGIDYSLNVYNYSKTIFCIDVNGLEKPNQMGRDVFVVWLSNDGKLSVTESVPGVSDGTLYYNNDCDPKASDIGGYGISCAYRIITEGKMNY